MKKPKPFSRPPGELSDEDAVADMKEEGEARRGKTKFNPIESTPGWRRIPRKDRLDEMDEKGDGNESMKRPSNVKNLWRSRLYGRDR